MQNNEKEQLSMLLDFLASHFVRKAKWADVSKAEWMHITDELNQLITITAKKHTAKTKPATIGNNYIYEHLIIRKMHLHKRGNKKSSTPNLTKLNTMVQCLGYTNYFDFIEKHSDSFNFSDLKITIPNIVENKKVLAELVGFWYSYNRNLPDNPSKIKEERIWRSAIEIYKSASTNEYLIERSGGDHHKYYGKITAYDDYIFIIMNSNTFIRQRHFVARVKDINEKLKQPGYILQQIHFISTCISFNKEPMALFEIFERCTKLKEFVNTSIDFPIDSNEISDYIRKQIKDASKNRLLNH